RPDARSRTPPARPPPGAPLAGRPAASRSGMTTGKLPPRGRAEGPTPFRSDNQGEPMITSRGRRKGWARVAVAIVLGVAMVVAGAAVAFAKGGVGGGGGGGTAKPPAGATSPFVTPTLNDPLFDV